MTRWATALAAIAWAWTAAACPETACAVEGGEYRVATPEGEGPFPAVLFLHGANARAEAIMGDGFARRYLARGYALIVPQGVPRTGGRGPNWGVRDGRAHPRDDMAFVARVADDAAARLPIDRGRTVLAGFSRGGSFVWDVACAHPERFDAYASTAGGFWDPLPESCAGPVRLHHVHGFADGTVPLEGRPLRSGAAQGDIYAGLAIWRETMGCGARAGGVQTDGALWRKIWTDCEAGALEFALHAGGHGIPRGWVEAVLDWHEGRPAD